MKICNLSFEYPPNGLGGLEKAVFEKVNGLSQKGCTMIVTPCHGYHKGKHLKLDSVYSVYIEKKGNLEIYRLSGGSLDEREVYNKLQTKIIDFSKTLNLLLKQFKPDIIDANDWTSTLPALVAKKNYSIPVVYTVHACNLSKIELSKKIKMNMDKGDLEQTMAIMPENWLKKNFSELALKPEYKLLGGISLELMGFFNSEKMVFVSRNYMLEIKKLIKKYSGKSINSSKIDYNYNILDNELKKELDKILENAEEKRIIERNKVLKKYGLDPGTMILAIGRLDARQKGIDVYLKTIEKLIDNEDLRFIVAGKGDPGIERGLKKISKKYPKKIAFLGFIEKKDKFRFYSVSDIFVLSSDFEPFGLTVIEAMYGGCPVVTTNSSGPGEIVRDVRNDVNGCGIIVPSRYNDFQGDNEKSSEALKFGILDILEIMSNNKKLDSLRKNSRKRANDFNINRSTKNLIRIYRSSIQ